MEKLDHLNILPPEYILESYHVCKNCLNEHKKGCCENYDSKQRTTTNIFTLVYFIIINGNKK